MKRAIGCLVLGALLLVPSMSWASPHRNYYGDWQRPRWQHKPQNHNHHFNHGGPRGSTYGYNWYRPDRSISGLISSGARSGRLTRDELRAIREEQEELRRKQYRYQADGRLSRRERRDLAEEYRELRDEVHEEIHDSERRGGKRRWRR